MTRVRVNRPYASAFPKPLVLAKGTKVTVTPRDSEWPGWAWSRTEDNQEGWIPETFLEVSSDDLYILKCNYDATELTVAAGRSVEVIKSTAGWLWCCNDDDQKGWVPADHTDWAKPPNHE
jgi:uncharacterized protein YgiM (DUF1202 family)